jgi:hypothetical protein
MASDDLAFDNSNETAGSDKTYPPGPSWLRAVLVATALAAAVWLLATRGETGEDETVGRAGRIEVTARLLECPEQFPDLGAYRYTYVLKYQVLEVYRQDPQGKYPLKTGDTIFVGHYRPRVPRSKAYDADCKHMVVGGKLDRFVAGEAHRMALDYELQDLAPSGALDYCFPPTGNRFFANWVNPTSY